MLLSFHAGMPIHPGIEARERPAALPPCPPFTGVRTVITFAAFFDLGPCSTPSPTGGEVWPNRCPEIHRGEGRGVSRGRPPPSDVWSCACGEKLRVQDEVEVLALECGWWAVAFVSE